MVDNSGLVFLVGILKNSMGERYWIQKELVIEASRNKTEDITAADGKPFKGYRISHNELIGADKLTIGLILRK